jgi:transcriptional repressor NF-X1
VERLCICGKQAIKNVPCWFKEPRCGKPCGKRLKCGTHFCNNVCHGPGNCEDAGVPGSHCNQPCLKLKSCGHVDTSPCHAPSACKEDQPCQGKTFVTCECQHRKQEVKCLAAKSNPHPERAPLKCDDECLRMQRNAKLAAALNIDPATHTDDHVPYSDVTLEFCRDHMQWAQGYEREFRVFASDPEEKRLRFKPMKPNQRKFIHALAEDFGLDSESQDPEPHRHVSIFKTPRFVSAPNKTLSQCVKLRALDTVSRLQPPTAAAALPTEPFNGLLLSSPRFGLTIEEVDSALSRSFASNPTLTFTTSFLPMDEVLIKGAGAWTPQALEASLTSLKPSVTQAVIRNGLAKSVNLCYADSSSNVLRRELDPSAKKSDGWSSVVGRGSVKAANAVARGPEPLPVRSKFIALRREPKKKVVETPVDDDWEEAADHLADEQ